MAVLSKGPENQDTLQYCYKTFYRKKVNPWQHTGSILVILTQQKKKAYVTLIAYLVAVMCRHCKSRIMLERATCFFNWDDKHNSHFQYTEYPVTLSTLRDHIPEGINRQKCYMNVVRFPTDTELRIFEIQYSCILQHRKFYGIAFSSVCFCQYTAFFMEMTSGMRPWLIDIKVPDIQRVNDKFTYVVKLW